MYYTSSHPRPLIKGISSSQALRLRKLFTNTLETSKNLQVLNEPFINIGFNEKLLVIEFHRLSEIQSNALLVPKLKEKEKNIIPFI